MNVSVVSTIYSAPNAQGFDNSAVSPAAKIAQYSHVQAVVDQFGPATIVDLSPQAQRVLEGEFIVITPNNT